MGLITIADRPTKYFIIITILTWTAIILYINYWPYGGKLMTLVIAFVATLAILYPLRKMLQTKHPWII